MSIFNDIMRFIYKIIVYPIKFILFEIIYFIEKNLINRNMSDICEECYEKVTLPYYVCPNCNNRYPALMPTFKHIFYFKCSCGNKLPLTALSGKNKLKTFCRKCKSEVSMNKVKKICIPIIGTNASLKTIFINNMIDTIEWKFDKPPFKAYLSTPKTQRFFLGKNEIKPSRKIYVFDANEKDLVLSDRVKKYRYFNYYDGIVFIFKREEITNINIEVDNELNLNDIFDIFILNLQKNYGLRPGEIINKAVAIIIDNPISTMSSWNKYIEEKFNAKIKNNFSNYRFFYNDNSNLRNQGKNEDKYYEAGVFQWILGQVDNKILRYTE
ncbi:hypothetical protein K9O30_05515 [Clostridium bowmanii]|uniref:hypothetical protein n=1 Tax=Clostridium bowmanii TaxID=132925 RepID=UPI001C0C5BEC|nr:hypothetical protein [Clostridium bowmanii]MBU3191643.1 hypothetical protein [Clostridium bowmanii]MCA1073203.1 hypothetical protein [Clostridium bowmanii]